MNAPQIFNKKTITGFTLLEILIALVIVGMALGTIFSLLAGSKRLAFSAAEHLQESLFLRAAINAGQVLEKPEYPEYPNAFRLRVSSAPEEALEPPERQTQKIQFVLEPFIITDSDSGLRLESLRWKKLTATQ
jgi:prepilin-type N-terminal cleavage/methylation domain-containing protein